MWGYGFLRMRALEGAYIDKDGILVLTKGKTAEEVRRLGDRVCDGKRDTIARLVAYLGYCPECGVMSPGPDGHHDDPPCSVASVLKKGDA